MPHKIVISGAKMASEPIAMSYIAQTSVIETCLPNVRWSSDGRLQQAWFVEELENMTTKSRRTEWREVPTEVSAQPTPAVME